MFNFIKNIIKSKPKPPSEAVVWDSTNNKWTKGVVIPSKNNNIFLSCRHCIPYVGLKVHIFLPDGSKFETTITEKITPDIQVNKTLPLSPTADKDRYWYGDIAICKVADPFPITPPKIKDFSSGKISVQHQRGNWSTHTVGYQKIWGVLYDLPNWIRTLWGKENFEQGDSGLPWFTLDKKTKEWVTVGITSRTSIDASQTPWSAESPRLGSTKFKQYLDNL